MSWDQQTYSFGTPNAQPPTPTQTPTSAQFPSPSFQTPANNSSFENRSGWTPTFAEEYSVFNATPGRLTGSHNPFAEASTPRPSTASTQFRRHSAAEGIDIAAEIASHVHHFSPNPTLQLPPVDPSNLLPSSPAPFSTTHNHIDDSADKDVTPKRPKKRLEEAFSGQTATPPASSKGSRKLAPKFSIDTMQDGPQSNQYDMSQTPTGHPSMVPFPSTSGDFFNYPMSAPATAPVFTNTRPFWDPEASMNDMDLNFTTHTAEMFDMGSPHKLNNSYDWERNNQMFQETINTVPESRSPQNETQLTMKRQRQLAPKLPATTAPLPTTLSTFDLSQTSAANNNFTIPNSGSVDPGLLFTQNNSSSGNPRSDDSRAPSRPVTSHVELRPYQHQLRERRRDQEELIRSRSFRELSSSRLTQRGTVSSPVRSSGRHGLQRSMSESRRTKTQDRPLPRAGRVSPSKSQRSITLRSIPELPTPRTRTEVKFTIDADGRARTETFLVREEPKTTRGGPSAIDEDWGPSQDESSSDDEPIIVPSRNTSFSLPSQGKPPSFALFDHSHRGQDTRSQYSHSESSSQRSFRQSSLGSEAETVLGEENPSGDAALELQRVRETRKRTQLKTQTLRHPSNPSRGGSSQYFYNTSSNPSPTSATDPDGATPTSSRSGSTRCVCHNPEAEGRPMIQCESCDNWLHMVCVRVDPRSVPNVYICAYCAQTPNMRGGRIREAARGNTHAASPLAHKSFRSFR